MPRIDGMSLRLNYAGGMRSDLRMQHDKLRTLKKALLYSYQSETAVLEDGREFRCLINPDKLKNDYDNKILSIPYEDICLNKEFTGMPTTQVEEEVGIKVGDIFTWKETDTKWIVYLQFLEESAYFRGEIRLCSNEVTIDGKNYWAYVRGPVETTIRWNQKSDIGWNDLNYSKILYMGENDVTKKLKRFDVIKVDGENYQVQVVNKDTASDGILIIYLKEFFTNTIEEENPPIENENVESEIKGDTIVYPYDVKIYTIDTFGGEWSISNSNAKIVTSDDSKVKIEVIAGRACSFDLIYTVGGSEIILPIEVKSF